MNQDILQGKWKQIKGQVREQWGRLTDNEVEQMQGDYEQLVGALQEHYGYDREEAEREVDAFLRTR